LDALVASRLRKADLEIATHRRRSGLVTHRRTAQQASES
jgi:hypothetical protein